MRHCSLPPPKALPSKFMSSFAVATAQALPLTCSEHPPVGAARSRSAGDAGHRDEGIRDVRLALARVQARRVLDRGGGGDPPWARVLHLLVLLVVVVVLLRLRLRLLLRLLRLRLLRLRLRLRLLRLRLLLLLLLLLCHSMPVDRGRQLHGDTSTATTTCM